MPRPRFYRLPPERQQAIVDVAARAFAEHGYDGTSYNHLLEDIGLSKGSAYYTFEGKADLYAEVLRREFAAAMEAIPPPIVSVDAGADAFWQGMTTWIRAFLGFAHEHPRFVVLARGFLNARASGQLPPLERELEQRLAGWVEEAIAAGQQADAVRDDLPAGLLAAMVSATLGVLDMEMLSRALPQDDEVDAMVELYTDTLQRLLAPGARG